MLAPVTPLPLRSFTLVVISSLDVITFISFGGARSLHLSAHGDLLLREARCYVSELEPHALFIVSNDTMRAGAGHPDGVLPRRQEIPFQRIQKSSDFSPKKPPLFRASLLFSSLFTLAGHMTLDQHGGY